MLSARLSVGSRSRAGDGTKANKLILGLDDRRKPAQGSSASASTGSSSSGNSNNRLMELVDKVAIRERLERSLFALVDVSIICPRRASNTSSRHTSQGEDFTQEIIGQAGVAFALKSSGLHLPSSGPGWSYKRQMPVSTVDVLPPGMCVVIHPGEQRFFLRHRPPSSANDADANVFLDLTASPQRDRLLIHDGMEIVIIDGRRKIEKVLKFGVPLSGSSHPDLSWHKQISPEELWKVRNQNNNNSSSQSYANNGQSYSQSTSTAADSTASSKTKSISWGVRVDLLGKTVTPLNDAEEDEPITFRGDADNTAFTRDMFVSIDGKEIARTKHDGPRKTVWFVSSLKHFESKQSKQDLQNSIVEELGGDEPFAMAVVLESDGTQLVLSKMHHDSALHRVLLRIPSTVVFPLVCSDTIVVRNSIKGDLCQFALRIPRTPRGLPTSERDRDELNPAQCLSDLGLELNNAATDGSAYSKQMIPKAYILNKKYFMAQPTVTIGRTDATLTMPDPHLSKTHATIRREARHFLMSPVDLRRSIYLLCGKSDSHSRPPMALRSGDTISCGKSEFKVVFQQRGSREINGGVDAIEELRSRLNALNLELQVRKKASNIVASPTHAPIVPAPASSTDKKDPDDLFVPPLESSFKNLKVDAPEASRDFSARTAQQRESEDESIANGVEVVFRNFNALMEHFEARDFGNGPLMILLTVKGPRAKQFFLCDPLETTIGSSPNAKISISIDRRMSPYHCRIYFDKYLHRWMLEDLQSMHGTFVRVEESTLMCSGDVFLMGSTMVRVHGRQVVSQTYQTSSSGRCISQ